jgi:hypothetical protein
MAEGRAAEALQWSLRAGAAYFVGVTAAHWEVAAWRRLARRDHNRRSRSATHG